MLRARIPSLALFVGLFAFVFADVSVHNCDGDLCLAPETTDGTVHVMGSLTIESGEVLVHNTQTGTNESLAEQLFRLFQAPCASSPCQNGGVCAVTGLSLATASYVCVCPRAWDGAQCETAVNGDCSSSPCLSGGTCVEEIVGGAGTTLVWRCVCPSGRAGPQCGQDTSISDPCVSSPCRNDGTCVSLYVVDSFGCACAAGFTGALCESDIDECLSSPCLNGGTCTNLGAGQGYVCTCATPYIGSPDCSIESCASSPCLYGGTCQASSAHGEDGFTCTCFAAYSGTQCQAPAAASSWSFRSFGSSGVDSVKAVKVHGASGSIFIGGNTGGQYGGTAGQRGFVARYALATGQLTTLREILPNDPSVSVLATDMSADASLHFACGYHSSTRKMFCDKIVYNVNSVSFSTPTYTMLPTASPSTDTSALAVRYDGVRDRLYVTGYTGAVVLTGTGVAQQSTQDVFLLAFTASTLTPVYAPQWGNGVGQAIAVNDDGTVVYLAVLATVSFEGHTSQGSNDRALVAVDATSGATLWIQMEPYSSIQSEDWGSLEFYLGELFAVGRFMGVNPLGVTVYRLDAHNGSVSNSFFFGNTVHPQTVRGMVDVEHGIYAISSELFDPLTAGVLEAELNETSTLGTGSTGVSYILCSLDTLKPFAFHRFAGSSPEAAGIALDTESRSVVVAGRAQSPLGVSDGQNLQLFITHNFY